MLFAVDATDGDVERVIRDFWRELPGDAEGRPYADALVRGVCSMRDTLDEKIASASQHWKVSRMTRVDRNVLRLGTWELATQPETPTAVILDEAVLLAKRYGTEASGAFANGILARVAAAVGREVSARAAGASGPESRSRKDEAS